MTRHPRSDPRIDATRGCKSPFLSSGEFAPGVWIARVGGGSDGSRRGTLGIAQRQIQAQVRTKIDHQGSGLGREPVSCVAASMAIIFSCRQFIKLVSKYLIAT